MFYHLYTIYHTIPLLGTALFYKRAEGPDTFVDEGITLHVALCFDEVCFEVLPLSARVLTCTSARSHFKRAQHPALELLAWKYTHLTSVAIICPWLRLSSGCCLVFPFKEPHDRDPGTNVFRQRSDPSKAYHYTHVGKIPSTTRTSMRHLHLACVPNVWHGVYAPWQVAPIVLDRYAKPNYPSQGSKRVSERKREFYRPLTELGGVRDFGMGWDCLRSRQSSGQFKPKES